MKDKDFLYWIHQRLISKGDDYNVDFLGKLRSIINKIPEDQYTPNISPPL